MEVAIDDQHYNVVVFDSQNCMDHELVNVASFIAHMTAHLTFWITLYEEMRRSHEAFGDSETIACALLRTSHIETSIGELLEGDLFFVKHLVDYHFNVAKTSGKLHLAHKHLRLNQLLQITKAVDALMLVDPCTAVTSLTFELDKARVRCSKIISIFKNFIIPRVVAGLWAWKTYERGKNSSEIDANEVNLLWMNILKLRALILLDNENNRLMNTTLKDAACIFRKCPISDSLRMGEYTMRDVWSVLKRLSWDWPLITPGPMTRRIVDGLWWRCAWLASQTMNSTIGNNLILIKRVGETLGGPPMFRVSDHFVTETERKFNMLCDTLWTLDWFEARCIDPEARIDKAFADRSHAQWMTYVRSSLTGQLRDFIKREFSKRIWVYNCRREEIERYNLDTRTTQGNPVKSIMQYHRADYDTILTVSNSSPLSVFQPACDMTLENIGLGLRWHQDHGSPVTNGIIEWQWPSVWELSATRDRGADGAFITSDFETFNVRLGDNGERVFTDKITGRRLRGEQATAAAALFASTTLQACKNEFDSIVESVLMVQMQATSKGNSPMLRAFSDIGEFITLRALPDGHDALSMAKAHKPAILRIGGYYIVYDGTRMLAQHPLLSYALAVWCREVDALVERHLVKLGVVCEGLCERLAGDSGEVSRENAIKMISKAAIIAEDVPPILRSIFGATRHSKTLERTGTYANSLILIDGAPAPSSWMGPRLRNALERHHLIDATPNMNQQQQRQQQQGQQNTPNKRATPKPGVAWH